MTQWKKEKNPCSVLHPTVPLSCWSGRQHFTPGLCLWSYPDLPALRTAGIWHTDIDSLGALELPLHCCSQSTDGISKQKLRLKIANSSRAGTMSSPSPSSPRQPKHGDRNSASPVAD